MTPQQVEKLLEVLYAVRQRPGMYIGELDPRLMATYLSGFQTALGGLVGFDGWYEAQEEVVTSRGWRLHSKEPFFGMQERGLSPAQIIEELVTIAIEVVGLRCVSPTHVSASLKPPGGV